MIHGFVVMAHVPFTEWEIIPCGSFMELRRYIEEGQQPDDLSEGLRKIWFRVDPAVTDGIAE
jgi:hypothetical protein